MAPIHSKLRQIDNCLQGEDMTMSQESQRLATFTNWPHEGLLLPANMAAAGFYYVGHNGSDDVRCFCCLKELNEWEKDDDPWKEHVKRPCFFASLGKPQGQLTVAQWLRVLAEREKNRIKKFEDTSRQLKDLIDHLEGN